MRLIEKIWFADHSAKWLLVPLLLPLSALFWLLSALRRLSFNLGWSKSYQLAQPVIVVGNIGIGGNGKTPMVIYLVELTRALGLTPGVISRGYGGQAPHYPYLVTANSTALEAGDEPVLIQQRCQVAVAVGSDRIASAELLISQGCDIIISDDGLQHYRLSRALELIIVDGKRLFGNGLLLPAGPLREGQWRLSSADLVIYNGQLPKEIAKETPEEATNEVPACHRLLMALAASELCNLKTGERINLAEFVTLNESVNAIAGIGAPQRFFDTLKSHDFAIKKQQSFVDHHSYTLADFSRFEDNIPLLMTEKDAVKCRGFCQSNWWYLPVTAKFTQEQQCIIRDKVNAVSKSGVAS